MGQADGAPPVDRVRALSASFSFSWPPLPPVRGPAELPADPPRTAPPTAATPSSRDAYQTLGKTFPDLILNDQDCFRTKDQWETLLALFPDQRASHPPSPRVRLPLASQARTPSSSA